MVNQRHISVETSGGFRYAGVGIPHATWRTSTRYSTHVSTTNPYLTINKPTVSVHYSLSAVRGQTKYTYDNALCQSTPKTCRNGLLMTQCVIQKRFFSPKVGHQHANLGHEGSPSTRWLARKRGPGWLRGGAHSLRAGGPLPFLPPLSPLSNNWNRARRLRP